jgi:alpha-amylase
MDLKRISLIFKVLILIVLTYSLAFQSNQSSGIIDSKINSNLRNFNENSARNTNTNKSELIPIGNKVLLQPFYWEMPDHGAFYKKLTAYMPDFAAAGFDSLWLPPPSKTEEGIHAMGGYEPFDYYDLGEFNQKGRIRTHYGTRGDLEALITEANNYNIGTICDVVINHRVGGEDEYNEFVGDNTPTNFMNVASGKLKMNYSHFWPNFYGTGDNKKYGIFPDICHKHPYVRSELIEWGLWLRDEIGFDGWRFDTADGVDPTMLRDWMQSVNGWGVAEYWMQEPDRTVIDSYISNTNNTVSAFDIPLIVEIRDMANQNGSYDMRRLATEGLYKIRSNAVTYAVNHDTYRDIFNIRFNRHMAYAYILTHEGYPSVFWMDWADLNLRNHLKTLVKIHNHFAKGTTSILHVDEDVYIAQRNGDPGLVIGINDHPTDWKTVSVTTKWKNTIISDLTSQSSNITTNSEGEASITIPPTGYVVYSNDKPLAELFDVPAVAGYTSPTEVANTSIVIDGDLDFNYGRPFYMDNINDGSLTPADLSNLYLKHDNTNLYVGIGYYNLGRWNSSTDVHYGIALDVKDGGSTEDPWLHSKIRWSGLGTQKKPDIIYYIETSSKADDYKRTIDKITQFEYDDDQGNWKSGVDVTSTIDHVSGDIAGLIELKIPLSDIKLDKGGSFRLKGFSTKEGFIGAIDSVPQDYTIDLSGETDSWLTLPEIINITVRQQITTKTSANFPDIYVIFVYIGILVLFSQKLKKR